MKITYEIKECLAEDGYTQDLEGLRAYSDDCAEEYGVDKEQAWAIMLLLGPSEAYDGFVTAIEDAAENE